MSQSSNHLRLFSWTWHEFTLLKWPPQSPDLNPIEHLWDVVEREICIIDVQPTNLQQLRDAIMPIWGKSLRNVSNTLLNLCHEEIRQFWRQKGVQPGTRKVYLIKWPVSVYLQYKYQKPSQHIFTALLSGALVKTGWFGLLFFEWRTARPTTGN